MWWSGVTRTKSWWASRWPSWSTGPSNASALIAWWSCARTSACSAGSRCCWTGGLGTGGDLGSSGVVDDAFNFTKTGPGIFTLAANNFYTGSTAITAGTLKLGGSEKIPDGTGKGSGTLNGSLDLAGFNETLNGLSGSGTVTNSGGAATLTVGNNDATTTFSGSLSGSGVSLALTKTGAGTLSLTGANTHAGATTVSSGTLAVTTTSLTSATAVTVSDAATLAVSIITPGLSLPVASLSFGTCTLSNALGVFGNPAVAVIAAPTLTLNGVVTVNLSGVGVAEGSFPLIDFNTIGGVGGVVVGTTPAGVVAHIETNGTDIVVVVDTAQKQIWEGYVDNLWDTTTLNWLDTAGLPVTNYTDFSSPVRFDDGALSNTTISVSSSFSPPAMVVSNSARAYAFSGVGTITTATVKKEGSGSLTFANDAVNPITSIILNEGTLAFNPPNDQAVTSVFSDTTAGTGTLAKEGANVLTLSGASGTFDGPIQVNAGTLKAGSTTALGSTSGATTIGNNATLDVNNKNLGLEPVRVSGAGVGGAGAIINSGADQINALRDVTLNGDTTFGGTGRWDIRSAAASDAFLTANGHNLVKVGANYVAIVGAATGGYWPLTLANVDIQAGTLSFEINTDLGDTNATINVYSNAAFSLYNTGLTNVLTKNLVMTNGTFRGGGPNSTPRGTNVFAGIGTRAGQRCWN